ncbi:SIMPL domain-containing protein [Streptomyces sp. H39-C1]|uniref:SIMPL domain-containing protein n=1 Tax=Streptomyces sp. H39-C1 TaxID=3004355 RepID=UPI0022B0319A|nr:SIMPL domain-containing protein [Streptomyces sp. H39-C1]MCZ4103434.1 SIMPL domain-containing protein [Streptomyces sp. H39-C1]
MQTTISTPWGVTSYGAASVQAAPDLARIRLGIDRTEASPQEAFAVARAGITALREAIRSHGVSDGRVSASRLGLETSWNGYGPERKFLGYRCQAAFAIELKELDSLEQLLIDAVQAGANHLESVDFDVRNKPELRAQARSAAVRTARAKAELYADAAGVQLGSVIHIEDVDPESIGAGRYRGHSDSGTVSEADLAPGAVVVSAAVVLGFSISPS